MPFSQVVILLDHHSAQIQMLDGAHLEKLTEHRRETRQHGSRVRSEHEFFSDVCDALQVHAEILVLAGRTAEADFKRYVEKHRPALAPRVVGWEIVDHPTPAQALAIARAFFDKHDRMLGRRHVS